MWKIRNLQTKKLLNLATIICLEFRQNHCFVGISRRNMKEASNFRKRIEALFSEIDVIFLKIMKKMSMMDSGEPRKLMTFEA